MKEIGAALASSVWGGIVSAWFVLKPLMPILVGFAALVGAGLLGALIRGFFPPFVLDDPFWRDFWTGPPAGGVFALIAAFVAFAAARIGANVSLRAARRQEWWDRAEWALNLAVSSDSAERDAGLAAAEVIISDATRTEAAMVDSVTSRLLKP